MPITSIVSLNQIITWFEDFQQNHYFLNDFGFGEPYDIGTSRQMDFPYMWVALNEDNNIATGTNVKSAIPDLSFSIMFMDKINIQENYLDQNGFQSDNSQEILSDTLQCLQDLITMIQQNWGQYGVLISQDVSFYPAVDETTDKATGVVGRFVLRTRQVNCVIPESPNTIVVQPNQPTYATLLTCENLEDCSTFKTYAYTGGTLSNGTLTVTSLNGHTFSVTGFTGGGGGGSNGTSGSSGVSGTSGSSGISGANGTNGSSGISGVSGTSGSSGVSGASGTNGTSGSSGISGDAGTSGSSGSSGSNGAPGTSGSSGSNGAPGTSGSSGSNGAPGSSGSSGANGTSGSSGQNGISGTSGISGSNGLSGVDGTSGSSGVNGAGGSSGSSGANGTSGSSGANGTSGSSGVSGAAGTSGSSGVSGTQGIAGTAGSSGVSGTAGTSGTSSAGSQMAYGSFSAPLQELSTSPTIVPLDTTGLTSNMYLSSNAIVVPTAGVYRVAAFYYIDLTTTGYAYLQLLINGSGVADYYTTVTTNENINQSIEKFVSLSANDTVSFNFARGGGATVGYMTVYQASVTQLA